MIKVMISSRCNSNINLEDNSVTTLTDLRKFLKKDLESQRLYGDRICKVWISDGSDAHSELSSSTQVCRKNAEKADILIIIYNGSAGWCPEGSPIGICHLEALAAQETNPMGVIFIQLNEKFWSRDPTQTDLLFREYVESNNFFRGGAEANTFEDVVRQVREEFTPKICKLVSIGSSRIGRAKSKSAEASKWLTFAFQPRAHNMKIAAQRCFDPVGDGIEGVTLKAKSERILLNCHALPDSWTNSREYVGEPHRNDLKNLGHLHKWSLIGPINLVVCQKNITIAQARKVVGVTDCITFSEEFGVYVADRAHGIQYFFLKNCSDSVTIAAQVRSLLEWLHASGHINIVVELATLRFKLLMAQSTVLETPMQLGAELKLLSFAEAK